MMRAALITAGLALGIATRALAQPPAIVIPEPSFVDHGASHMPPADSSEPPQLGHGAVAPPTGHPRLAFGPFSLDMGNSDFGKGSPDLGRDIRHSHFARVHLDDLHVFGGDVSGGFDGRGATVQLHWPTSQ
jgi:hypothetical protein